MRKIFIIHILLAMPLLAWCDNITFADAEVKSICVKNWDTNGDGELSKAEAAAVTDLGNAFPSKKSVKSFDELKYFTGLTIIRNSAFIGCSGLTSITIPNSVTSIGRLAFSDCSSLASVTIPNSVSSIGESAFFCCSCLPSVTIPNSVTSIGNSAFYGCSSLTSVTIPNSVTSIGSSTFQDCSGLTTVTVPSSVTSIGNSAFYGCSSLPSVTIPNSVSSIGESAFGNCSSLTSVTIPNSVTSIGRYAFAYCFSLPSVTIPNSVSSIGERAFMYCSGLTSVNISNSVTSIESYTFAGCRSLASVTIPNSVTSIGAHAFSYCSTVKICSTKPFSIENSSFANRATIYVPKDCKDAYLSAEKWNGNGYTFIEYPNSDVNQDGAIDVVDVVDIARYVVGSPSSSFHEIIADLNSDDLVNVADAVVLVNDIAGNTSFAKAWHGMQSSDDIQEQLMLTKNRDNSQSLCMDNSRAYTAFQFDLMMNSDVNVMQMLLNDSRENGHQLLYNKVGDGHYRVVALSTANNSFNGKNGELLNIQLDGFDTDDLTIHNVHFFTGQGNDYAFDDLKLQGGTTAINELPHVEGDQPATVYDLQGRKQPTLRRGINIMNGKKVIIK